MKPDVHRRPEAIEEDIDRTRRDIDSTLSELRNRLSSRELVDQAIDYVRHSGATEFVSNLQGSVKNNPLPVSLVGIGLAWLMMADRRDRRGYGETSSFDTSEYASEYTSESPSLGERVDRVKASAASARQRVSETTHAARQRVSETTHAAREHAARIGEGARHQWERARSGYQTVAREQPLALGAIGLAIGAFMAAVLPRTRQEDELMGPASDRLTEQAKAAGEEQLGKIQRVASAAGNAAVDEARRQESQETDSGRLQGSEPARARVTPET